MALLALAFLLLTTASSRAQPISFMETDELRRGMRGYGLTTFHGTRIDTFQVEILGVMKAVRSPQRDRILARFAGGSLEHTGIIAGMSGSPVYVEDRLIGAVSHGWTFGKDPVGGITPINDMLAVARRPDLAPEQNYRQTMELDAATTRGLGGLGTSTLKPLATPLAVAGFSGAARQVLHETLAPMGIQILDTAAGSEQSDRPPPPLCCRGVAGRANDSRRL